MKVGPNGKPTILYHFPDNKNVTYSWNVSDCPDPVNTIQVKKERTPRPFVYIINVIFKSKYDFYCAT